MKHGRRVREIDPVRPQIGGGLLWVPLEIHELRVCTSVHTVKALRLSGLPT
jgi:hypothetical protein